MGLGAHRFITKCIVDHPNDLSLPIVLKDAHYCMLGGNKKCKAPLLVNYPVRLQVLRVRMLHR